MTDPKPRRWFQMHLSTALVLMIWASAFVGLNVYPSVKPFDQAQNIGGDIPWTGAIPSAVVEQGWPHAYRIQWSDNIGGEYPARFFAKRLAMDVFAGIAVGAGIVFLMSLLRSTTLRAGDAHSGTSA